MPQCVHMSEDSLWYQSLPSSLYEMEFTALSIGFIGPQASGAFFPFCPSPCIGAGGLQMPFTRSGFNGLKGFELRSCAYAVFTH